MNNKSSPSSSSPLPRLRDQPQHPRSSPLLTSSITMNHPDSDSINTPMTSSQTTPFSWFSGLRAKIAQLSQMSDWLSQLGLGSAIAQQGQPVSPPTPVARRSRTDRMSLSSPGGVHELNSLPSRSQSVAVVNENGYDTMHSLNSLLFDEIAITPVVDDPDSHWEFGPSFWSAIEPGRIHDDTLERQHFGPLGNLVVISPGQCQPGQRHQFQPLSLVHPTWCDKCGDFIWGFLWRAVKCERCNYTCHEKCRALVTLPCRSTDNSIKSDTFPSIYPSLTGKSTDSDKENANHHFQQVDQFMDNVQLQNPLFDENFRVPPSAPPIALADFIGSAPVRVEEIYVNAVEHLEWPEDEYRDAKLKLMIDEYNKSANGLNITLQEDGVNFSGYLQVHMNFTRPINVVAGEHPPTVYDVVNSGTGKSTANNKQHRTITSFFLPRNTVKTLNINSTTTTRHMIVTLLRKFKVADNPRKFALYERIQEDISETRTILKKMIRIGDEVCPLRLMLSWGEQDRRSRQLVLQENDTGDILWDAFEVPELENFLRILDLEEQQYLHQIRQRFQAYRQHVDNHLRAKGAHPSDPSPSPRTRRPFAGDLHSSDPSPSPRTGRPFAGDLHSASTVVSSETTIDNDDSTMRILNNDDDDETEQFNTASSRVLAFDNPLYSSIASTRL